MRTNSINLTRESHNTSHRKLQHTRLEHSKQQQQLAGLSVSLIHFSTAQSRDPSICITPSYISDKKIA